MMNGFVHESEYKGSEWQRLSEWSLSLNLGFVFKHGFSFDTSINIKYYSLSWKINPEYYNDIFFVFCYIFIDKFGVKLLHSSDIKVMDVREVV